MQYIFQYMYVTVNKTLYLFPHRLFNQYLDKSYYKMFHLNGNWLQQFQNLVFINIYDKLNKPLKFKKNPFKGKLKWKLYYATKRQNVVLNLRVESNNMKTGTLTERVDSLLWTRENTKLSGLYL